MTVDAADAVATGVMSISAVSKSFGDVSVLADISFNIGHREIVALAGENGAGKSTLLDILCGVTHADVGQLAVNQAPLVFRSPKDALEAGVFRVFQEQSLLPKLPVYLNLCAGMEEEFSWFGYARHDAMRAHARRILTLLDLSIDVSSVTSRYSFGQRQMLELARILSMAHVYSARNPVVLLDEPTAALSGAELEFFFDLLKKLRDDFNASFIFVSHRLNELQRVADRLLVLKDGHIVSEVPPGTDEAEIHRLMVGREKSSDVYKVNRRRQTFGEVRLRSVAISSSRFSPINFEIRAGEVVGFGGLLGSGKHDVAEALAWGKNFQGALEVDGNTLDKRSGAISRIEAGVGYIPLHRHADGIFLGHSVADNINSVNNGCQSALTVRARTSERNNAEHWTEKLSIRARSISQMARTISGGNQQKIVFAKWASNDPGVIIADNPTRGVDAGAKEEIYDILRDLTDAGIAVLLITDDLVELIQLSNRILIMRDGVISYDSLVDSSSESEDSEEELVSKMV